MGRQVKAQAGVYVIASDIGLLKIGVSARPILRLAGLQGASPAELKLAHFEVFEGVNAFLVEKAAHALLAPERVRGEWFAVTVDQAKLAIAIAAGEVKARPIDEVIGGDGPNTEFAAWQERLNISSVEAARLLGKSEDTITRYRRKVPDHAEGVISLACFAIENGIPPWGAIEPKTITRKAAA